ncbi:MAG: hypothetical protein JWN95_1150 [Frankiales bacterium]|nr:hypothetical protein [Frankiales bacterium]
MSNFLARHPPWRQQAITAGVLPAMIALAVLGFAWPAARIAPRSLPVGIVGTTAASQRAVAALNKAQPNGFDFHLYADDAAARAAIRNRDIYGAFIVSGADVTVLEASAASSTVAQLLTGTGQRLASSATRPAASATRPAADQSPLALTSVDVVPASASDPRGLVLSSSLLPLTICSVIIASAVGLVIGFRPAWRQLVALVATSAVAGVGVYLIAQAFLGALPDNPVATSAAISLTMLAISATTAGLIALIGTAGFALGAILMVFVGNPFSGVTSAPQLLPAGVDHLGQWLPPGAGANLLRSTAYFYGNGAEGHLAVLLAWTAFGVAAIVVGHHTSPALAASQARRRATSAGAPTGLGFCATAESSRRGQLRPAGRPRNPE